MMPLAWPSTTTRSSISDWVCSLIPPEPTPGKRRVGAEEQLLAGLAPGVEGARDLGAAERAVGEEPAVLAGERDALGHALVDDVDRHLGQPVDVRLAGAVVAALDRVVEEPVDAVAVVLVVLRRVDAALRRDRVRAPRAVVEDEAAHLVAELGERRRGGRAREARAHDDHLVLALVRRVDEADVRLVPRHFPESSPAGILRVECCHGLPGLTKHSQEDAARGIARLPRK
jgi:hypothetical protein